MEVYLIRHTEIVVDNGVCYGQSDVALKKPYLKRFAAISKQIKTEHPVIYSSSLKRCEILSYYLHRHKKGLQTVKFDDRLKELNFGQWELKKWDNIDIELLNDWMLDFVTQTAPSGESFNQLYKRVNDFIEMTLLKEMVKEPVIIVTHAGVIRCFLCRAQHIPLKDAFNLEVQYGSVFKIRIDKKTNKPSRTISSS